LVDQTDARKATARRFGRLPEAVCAGISAMVQAAAK
jgi:hypothetical protein